MKKFLAILLAVLMVATCVLAFAACDKGGNDDDNNKGSNNTTANSGNSSTATEEEGGSDAGTVPAKPVLKMATNAYFQPYEFYKGEEIVGIDAEIAAAIANYLGYDLVIQDMEFDTIITAVKEGSVDFGMAGMTVTPERELEINFSNSYATGVQSIIVPENSPITNVDDLYADGASYKIGVQQGPTGDIYATDDFGADNVVAYNNGNNAVLALVGGELDCVIIDNEPAKALVNANSGLKILESSYADEDYAICVKKENTELLNKINEAIVALTADGTIDAIVAKYIPAN